MEGSEEAGQESAENGIQLLVDMGFPREKAEEAMRKAGNQSVELAAAYLLSSEAPGEMGEGLEDEWEDVEYNYKMVFVVNTGLNMSIGKTAAQVAHGCLGLYQDIEHKQEHQEWIQGLKDWIEEGQKKIVLSGTNVEELMHLQEKAKVLGVPCHLVQDAGHTEIAPGSCTVLALFGAEDEVNKITGSLRHPFFTWALLL